MAENFLEQLDQRIQKNEAVNASEVADAYTRTIDARRKEYLAKGGTYEKFEQDEKAFLDAARELRNKQLERIGVLGKEYEAKQQATVNEAKEKERGVRLDASLKFGREKTDPDKGPIDDYEGTGNYDTYGFGRQSLSGYLAAMQSMSPDAANRDFQKAVAAFKASNNAGTGFGAWLEETFTMDEHLSDENVKKIIGHENLTLADGFDLAMESKAFIAGYMHYSDELFPDANLSKAYKNYVRNKLTELKDNGKLAYTDPKAKDGKRSEDWVVETEKSKQQIAAFAAILNPQEWDTAWKERLQKSFEPFKKTCDTLLAANPDFRFTDPVIQEMLAKTSVTYLDDAKLNEARTKAAKEIYAYMKGKKDDFAKTIDANKKKAEDLKARNKALHGPGVTEEEWKAFDASMAQQSLDLDAAAFAENSSLEDLGKMWNKLVFVRDSSGLVKTQLESFEKKTKDAEEKEPYVMKFLGEKNMKESVDASGKQYRYELGDMVYSGNAGKISASYNNPDVQKLFEAKSSAFANSLYAKKRLTPQENREYRAILEKAKKHENDKAQWNADMKEAMDYLIGKTTAKLSSEDVAKLQTIERLSNQAKLDCVLTFDHRPSLDELQKAYKEKFVPAWEKAGKDFDAQVSSNAAPGGTPGASGGSGGNGGEQPSGAVGGGFLGNTGADVPNPTPSSLDPYSEKWDTGKDVPMPEGFKGFKGGLQVSPAVETIKFRDVDTHKPLMDVPGGTGASSTEITLAEPDGMAHQVEDRTYVKVNYQGKVYYAALEFLQKNDEALKAEQAAKKPDSAPAKPETKETGLDALGKINSEYITALELIQEKGESSSPVKFSILYNKQQVPCTFVKAGPENYQLEYAGIRASFKTLLDAMRALNGGYVVQQMTFSTMSKQENYKPYEKMIDEFKENVKVSPNGEIYFELDWSGRGRGEGNAQVWARPTIYGGIDYRIRRDFVGPNGESDRTGFAANFDDFMHHLAHIKTWSENFGNRRDAGKMSRLTMDNELRYMWTSDPRNFYVVEDRIGRPVSFDVLTNGVTRMFLNWGGGSATDINLNPALNLWINDDGSVSYIVNFKGAGIIQGEKRAPDLETIFKDLEALRKKAGEGPQAAPPAAPSSDTKTGKEPRTGGRAPKAPVAKPA